VADCICLMGLQKHEVVPVDTHVFQITAQFYMPEYLNNSKQSVTKKMHEDIGRFYIDRFGPYAGWAHSVLFSARLKRFGASMSDSKVKEIKTTQTIDLPDTLHCILRHNMEKRRRKNPEFTTHRGQHQWVHHQGSLRFQSKCGLLVRPEG